MGTEMFSTYQPGSDVAVAFRAAVHDEIDSARAERRGIPHCSIFGKQDLGFVVEDHPPLALDDAMQLASELVFDDCDGPAPGAGGQRRRVHLR